MSFINPVMIDYAKNSKSIIVDLINGSNGLSLRDDDLGFGLPKIISPDPDGRNTALELRPGPEARYYGSAWVSYKRLNLNILDDMLDGTVQIPVPELPFRIHDILPTINKALGINLSTRDVENTLYVTPDEFYEIKVNEKTSLAWIGSYLFIPNWLAENLIVDDELHILMTSTLPTKGYLVD